MAKKFTLMRIASHDFNRALRVWRTYLSAAEIFERLIGQRAHMLQVGMRSLGLAVVGTLWLAANKSELVLKVSLIDVAVPVAYVIFAVAFLTFAALINLINWAVLNEFTRIASNRLFRFDNSSALEVLQNGASAGPLAWNPQYRFLTSGKAHERLGIWIMRLMMLPFFAVLMVVYWTIFARGIDLFLREGFSIGVVFMAIGWILAVIPIILSTLFFIRFKFAKNISFIRWCFLLRLYRRTGTWPPRIDYWLANKTV